MTQQMGCTRSVVDYYENVTIERPIDACLASKPERDTGITIVFKRQAYSDTGWQTSGPETVLYKRGLRAWKENQLEDAQMNFQTLVNAYPNSPLASRAKKFLENIRNR
jgi:TolA-binding protein